MTSLRLPPDLLASLHDAAPPGTSLSALIRHLLDQEGGPAAVRARLERERRRAGNRVRIERLRRTGHRSMVLAPGHQEGLAWAASGWVRALEKQGQRRHDPVNRTIHLTKGRPISPRSRPGNRLVLRRSGLPR